MRQFDTGATRDTDEGKLDYEAYFSPRVLRARAEYMARHAVQADGERRPGDNWQKGMPFGEYMKSLWRHFFDVWSLWRSGYGDDGTQADLVESLCAVMFNAEGMLHELLRD
jgi:hypothetical protein